MAKNPKVNYFALPDSGFYIEANNTKTGDDLYLVQMQQLFQVVNENTDTPNSNCAKFYGDKQYYCFYAEHLIQFVQSPLFIIQS